MNTLSDHTRMSSPSDLVLATYGSPLRKPVIGSLLAVALIALTVLGLIQLRPFLRISDTQYFSTLLTALGVTGAISLVAVFVLRWLDRREPEPWLFYLLSFAWGSLIATAIAGDVNTRVGQVLGGLLGSILTAPFIEEGSKGLGLLVFVLLLRDEFDGPRDGFIYGALVGLGFNWLESSVYIARSLQEGGSVAWTFQLASRYALAGLNGHALYTGLFGSFLGFALIQKTRSKAITLPIIGYFLAAGSHMAWNLLGTVSFAAISTALSMLTMSPEMQTALQKDSTLAPFWLSWPANLAALVLANGFTLAIVITGLRRSGRWERGVMVEQLRDEVSVPAGAPVVTVEEYAQMEGRCESPRGDTAARRIFVTQCNLAKRKYRLHLQARSVDDDPVVRAWREELQLLRQSAQGDTK